MCSEPKAPEPTVEDPIVAEIKSTHVVCPRCDETAYDEAAGYCEECGFEGFDGDQ